MTPHQLETTLAAHFSKDATCWSQATDEVRDLARTARESLGMSESRAVNFTVLRTPAQWNRQGIEGILFFYECMTSEQQKAFIVQASLMFPDIFNN